MNSKLITEMLSVLTSDMGDLLNDKELMKGVNRLLLQFGFEIKPIELNHDQIAPRNPHAPLPKDNVRLCYRLKGQTFYSTWVGSCRHEMLKELIKKHGGEINTIEFR